MLIRPIQPQDAAQIAALYQQSAQHLKSLGDVSDFLFDAESFLKHGFSPHPAFDGLVAQLEEHIVGYLLYSFFFDTDQAGKVMHVLDLLVDQAHRQQGIGTALMQRARKVATSQGAKGLFWAVYKDNNLAETFYTRLGATRVKDVFFMTLDTEKP